MVDLLSAGLDGAGPLRSVPPNVYLARVAGTSGEALDPERGRRLARTLGAELYVLGEIVANGKRVLIGATMYDRSRKDPVARSSVEGNSDNIFELVDRLAANLIASPLGLARRAPVARRGHNHFARCRRSRPTSGESAPSTMDATPRRSKRSNRRWRLTAPSPLPTTG